VDGIADRFLRERRHLVGRRNDGDANRLVGPARYGETDTVEGNRTLLDDVLVELLGDAELELPVLADLTDVAYLCDAVDVSLYEVAVEAVVGC